MRVTEQNFQIHIQSKNDDKSSTKTLNIMIFQLYKYMLSQAHSIFIALATKRCSIYS